MTNAFVLAGCCVPLGDTMWMNFGTMFAKVPTATAVELISQGTLTLQRQLLRPQHLIRRQAL
eukprot:m.260277 g.260277  ORF g.260277 m.260277 type:complete len:62 (+) comp15557_c0_seq1:390-575(+)